MAAAIPIRRFRCKGCKRTFSWRPPFLVFGHRLAAAAYQQAFKQWATGGGRRSDGRTDASWYALGLSARKSFFKRLNQRLDLFLGRLLKSQSGLALADKKSQLWYAARRHARITVSSDKQSHLSCHFVFLANARHRLSNAPYSLKSA